MKVNALCLVVAVLLSVEALNDPAAGVLQAEGKKPAEGADAAVAAVVDDHKILYSDIDRVIKQKPKYAAYLAVGKNAAAKNPDQRDAEQRNAQMLQRIRKSVLDSLIDRQLLIQASKTSKVVTEKEVEEASEKVIANNGGEERLAEMLKTVGSNLEEFKKDLHDDMLVSQYLDKEVFNSVKVEDAEIRKVFESNPEHFSQPETANARHILIKVAKDASPEADKAAKGRIDALYTEVKKDNADFAAIAKDKSECPSAAKGGDLGYFPHGAMVPEFDKAAFALTPEEISAPIRTEFGYHIIKLEDRKPGGKPDFETARPEIQRELLTKKKVELVQALVKKLKNNAKIEMKNSKAA